MLFAIANFLPLLLENRNNFQHFSNLKECYFIFTQKSMHTPKKSLSILPDNFSECAK